MKQAELPISGVLDKLEQLNDPKTLSEGLDILCKLTANIIANPFEAKFRNIKATNAVIKQKVMSLHHMERVLAQLGFERVSEELFTLKDEHVGDFLENEPQLGYRRRLVTAKLASPLQYEKELLLIKLHKQQKEEQRIRDIESNRLKTQCEYDRQERKHMKADETKSNQLKFGTATNTFKDIGVDLCAKKSG